MDDASSQGWLVELSIPQTASVIKKPVEDRIVIGRVDKLKGTIPDVDLTAWGGLEFGIAPQHVAIFTHGDQLNIVDLASGRPVLLNTVPMDPGVPQRLLSGAQLQLGVLELEVKILGAPSGVEIGYQAHGANPPRKGPPGRGQPILVVEDEHETAEIFRLIMERAGYVPFICHEVVTAIRYLNTQTPSAVILDLMLPDIHGLELCRYVRRDIDQHDLPIVVVTAGVTRINMVEAMEAGGDVFLGKPVGMKELVRVVSTLIEWHEARMLYMKTKRLDGTDTLRSMPADVRRDAIVIFVADHDEPLAIVVPDRITIGRRGGGYVPRPHVDLDRHGAFEAGVSRVHAAIHRDDTGFYIEDLDSSNGTRLNDVKLPPNERQPLPNASEVRLGSLQLRLFYFTEEDETSLPDAKEEEEPPGSETIQQRPASLEAAIAPPPAAQDGHESPEAPADSAEPPVSPEDTAAMPISPDTQTDS